MALITQSKSFELTTPLISMQESCVIPAVSVGQGLLVVSAFAFQTISSVTWNNIPLRRDAYIEGNTLKGGVYSLWVTDSATADVVVAMASSSPVAISALAVYGLSTGSIPSGSTAGITTGTSDTPAISAAGIAQANIYVHGVLGTDGPIIDDPGNWVYNAVYSSGQVRYNGQRNGTNTTGILQVNLSDGYEMTTTGNGQNIGNLYFAGKTGIPEREFIIAVVPYQ